MPLQLPFLKTKCGAIYAGREVVPIIHHCSSVEGEKKPRHLSLSASITDVFSTWQQHCSPVSWKQCLTLSWTYFPERWQRSGHDSCTCMNHSAMVRNRNSLWSILKLDNSLKGMEVVERHCNITQRLLINSHFLVPLEPNTQIYSWHSRAFKVMCAVSVPLHCKNKNKVFVVYTKLRWKFRFNSFI